MTALLHVFALLVGALTPVQVGINASLRFALQDPLLAGLANFMVGGLCIFMVAMATGSTIPGLHVMGAVPAWAWTGGVIGAIFVVSTLVLGPKLGAATLFVLVVTGQMLGSMLLDHFGLLGFPVRAISPMRLLGVGLLIVGILLIVKN